MTIAPDRVWPTLPLDEWATDRGTPLQLWTQIVGNLRLAPASTMSLCWSVPRCITA